jgi:hypothetical protein
MVKEFAGVQNSGSFQIIFMLSAGNLELLRAQGVLRILLWNLHVRRAQGVTFRQVALREKVELRDRKLEFFCCVFLEWAALLKEPRWFQLRIWADFENGGRLLLRNSHVRRC